MSFRKSEASADRTSFLPEQISIKIKAGQRKPFRGLILEPMKAHVEGQRSLKSFRVVDSFP